MGSGDLALTVQDADTCAGCTIVLADNISSTSTMTKKMFPTQQKTWDPSDDPNDFNGSQMINRKTHGGLTKIFLLPSIPFDLNLSVTIKASGATLPLASGNITHMSVYHPFPLRIEGRQYDACFQIGEFGSRNKVRLPFGEFDLGELVKGTGVVVLIPLASGSDITGPGAQFVSSFAGLMTSAANGVSVPSLKIGDILDVNRPFYTWKNTDGTRVIVMSEPVTISASNMGSIQMSTPATPPADAIHEIHPAQYKPVAPAPKPPVRIGQPAVDLSIIGEDKKNIFIKVLQSAGYIVAIFLVIWLTVRFANSDTGKNIVDGIGLGLSRLWRGIGGASARAGQGIRSGAAAAGSAIGSAAGAAGSAIGSAAGAAGNAASAAGSAIGSAASAGVKGARNVAGKVSLGPNPFARRLPTADEQQANRAAKEATAAADRERTAKLVAANKAKRLAATVGAFQVKNPLLAKPTDNSAAAGVGYLKPAPTVGNVPRGLLPAKKNVNGTFSQENTLRKALAAKRAAAPVAKRTRNVNPEPKDGEESTAGEAEQAEEESKRKAAAAKPFTLKPVENATGPLASAVQQQRNLGRGQLTGEPALQARGLTGRPRGGRRRRRMKTGRRV